MQQPMHQQMSPHMQLPIPQPGSHPIQQPINQQMPSQVQQPIPPHSVPQSAQPPHHSPPQYDQGYNSFSTPAPVYNVSEKVQQQCQSNDIKNNVNYPLNQPSNHEIEFHVAFNGDTDFIFPSGGDKDHSTYTIKWNKIYWKNRIEIFYHKDLDMDQSDLISQVALSVAPNTDMYKGKYEVQNEGWNINDSEAWLKLRCVQGDCATNWLCEVDMKTESVGKLGTNGLMGVDNDAAKLQSLHEQVAVFMVHKQQFARYSRQILFPRRSNNSGSNNGFATAVISVC